MSALVNGALTVGAFAAVGVSTIVLVVAAAVFVQNDVRLTAMMQSYEQNHRSCAPYRGTVMGFAP